MRSSPSIKRYSAVLLQVVIVFVGIAAIVALLWEPQVEGANAHATNFDIYFKDPFLALVYVGSIPFFIALYQAFKVLGHVRQNQIFSEAAIKALRTIQYCALAIIGFVVVEETFITIANNGDDRAGAVLIGVVIIVFSVVIATVAAMFERVVQKNAPGS